MQVFVVLEMKSDTDEIAELAGIFSTEEQAKKFAQDRYQQANWGSPVPPHDIVPWDVDGSEVDIDINYLPEYGGWRAVGFAVDSGKELKLDSGVYATTKQAVAEARKQLERRGFCVRFSPTD